MCDVAVAEYLCQQCGRLSFCLKCSVSLHDNKFLGAHKLTPIDEPGKGPCIAVGDLKGLLQQTVAPARASPPPVPTSDIDVPADYKERYMDDGGAGEQKGAEESPLDLVGIASDRRLLRARVSEVDRCSELLRRIATKSAHEKAHSAEATKTAAAAVHRRFDLVRQLLATKEQEYVEVIEAAGKRRLDAATRTATGVSVAATETASYVQHMTTQLDRLEGSNRQFNDCRRTMLEDVAERTRQIDQQVADFERDLEEVQSVSLGLAVHLNHVIDAVQALEAPAFPIGGVSEPPPRAVPADKFLSEVGVQQWRGDGTLVSRGTPSESAVLAAAPTPRKSLAQTVDELRRTPIPAHATSSAGTEAASQVHSARSPMRRAASPMAAPAAPAANATTHGGGVKGNAIARAAARYQQQPSSGGKTFPSELDTLKKHIAQRSVRRTSSHTPAGGDTDEWERPVPAPVQPMSRGRTPTRGTNSRVGSPAARQATATAPKTGPGTPSARAMSPTAAMRARMAAKTDTPANAPGPGAYFASTNARGGAITGTPQRRGVSPRR
jgi:hypothetical protein